MHLFARGAGQVSIHPDGVPGKRFEIQHWLATHGFAWQEGWGTPSYAADMSTATWCWRFIGNDPLSAENVAL